MKENGSNGRANISPPFLWLTQVCPRTAAMPDIVVKGERGTFKNAQL